ncbi:protein translocase subunit SecD [Spirochaetia bacterium 38H-sp]|uniref:Protein translocase subunit SecD n=1 Tax=Rarispira pelagica TaxID=3141764 RepID=A0ABU9UC80_9SPIR
MSKKARLFIVLAVMAIGGWFLYPTVKWYFFVSEEDKKIAQSSMEEIRVYAQSFAADLSSELIELVKSNPDAKIDEKFSFLIDIAKKYYQRLEKDIPAEWTYANLLSVFPGKAKLFEEIEDYQRERILALKDLRSGSLQLGLDLSGGLSVTLAPDFTSLAERLGKEPTEEQKNEAMDSVMEILNNRIDQFGVTEPQIRRLENQKIVIDIPGDPDPTRVNDFIAGKGRLTFHLVDEETTQKLIEYQNANGAMTPEVLASRVDFVPAGTRIAGYYVKDNYGSDKFMYSVAIYDEVGLDGSYLTDARISLYNGQPLVLFTLSAEGGEIFYKLTSANIGKKLAIVLDGKVKEYKTVIKSAIRDRVQIEGFSIDEAQKVKTLLKTAALPVDLVIENYQKVGASLGEDSIKQGVQAIIYGLILVAGFMLLWYKGAGLVADIALTLNLFLLTAILSPLGFTMTLTSIAGVILTVGMAVDANVIIYERIKEELRLGKSPAAAVKAGFGKAFWTIVDANVTTFIAALFLSSIGSGPIKGFAVTLAFGIMSSMFTSLFVSRLLFDFGVEQLKVKKLSISWRL